jgi:predicted nucleic acid-binding protein
VPLSFVSIQDRPALPETLYLDAGVFFRFALKPHEDHHPVVNLMKDAATGPSRMYTSSIVVPEVNDAVYKWLLRKNPELIKAPSLVDDSVWEQVQQVTDSIERLIARAHIEACKADGPTRAHAWRLQREKKLRSFDAIHLATCLRRSFRTVVTFDDDLHAIEDASIWTSAKLAKAWPQRLAVKAAKPAIPGPQEASPP